MVIYLYLDESGTLKLAKGPANYFVMAVLGIAKPAPLRQVGEPQGHSADGGGQAEREAD